MHVPKTGGNTIQKELIDKKKSMDYLSIRKYQYAENMLGISGELTKSKH